MITLMMILMPATFDDDDGDGDDETDGVRHGP